MEGVTIYLTGTTVLMLYLSALVFSMFVIDRVMKKPQNTSETMMISIKQPIPVCLASDSAEEEEEDEEEDSEPEETDEPSETESPSETKDLENKEETEKED